MSINPSIFKAYDVRGLYPSEVNEEAARQIGRGFVAYLDAKRIAVSRDMRVSSPSVAAAFIDGARAQGADVVDYGMMGTDMMYYAVARDGLDGGAQITASHNPKRIQRHQDGAARGVSAQRRRRHRRHPRHDRQRPAAAAKPPQPGGLSQKHVLDDYVEQVLVVHRPVDHQAVQRRARCRQRHRRDGRAAAVRAAALPDHRAVHGGRRHLSQPRSQSR